MLLSPALRYLAKEPVSIILMPDTTVAFKRLQLLLRTEFILFILQAAAQTDLADHYLVRPY